MTINLKYHLKSNSKYKDRMEVLHSVGKVISEHGVFPWISFNMWVGCWLNPEDREDVDSITDEAIDRLYNDRLLFPHHKL